MPDDLRPTPPNAKLAYLIEAEPPTANFREDVIAGLSSRPRSIPPKYFYDDTGASLFEKICTTEEYYVTRAETGLLKQIAPEIAEIAGSHANLIEPGSGAAEKVRTLLKALDHPAEYCLFDISREQMERVAFDINAEFPDLRVGAIAGDFSRTFPVDEKMFAGAGKRICYFPGGTIGNFNPKAQIDLLNTFKTPLRTGDGILLGVDRAKDTAKLDAAYNDAPGYTEAFNLNLLTRLQNELGADLDTASWEHSSFYDPVLKRIQMYLVAIRPTQIILDDHLFAFEAGERIHTEDSWKFDVERLEALAEHCRLEIRKLWGMPDSDFLITWLEVMAP